MPRSASESPAAFSAAAISSGVPRTTGFAIFLSTHAHAAVMTRSSMPSGSTTVLSSAAALSIIFSIAFIFFSFFLFLRRDGVIAPYLLAA